MRKLFSISIVLTLGIFWVSTATAETDFSFQKKLVPNDQGEDMTRLQEIDVRIAELQAKIAELTQQLIALQAPAEIAKEVQAQILFSAPLSLGMRNEEVQKLQEILAKDPQVYPEGLVTGYFGPLTHAAVIRFQEKYAEEILEPISLPAGTGFVGERTLAKLNEVYAGSTLSTPVSLPGAPLAEANPASLQPTTESTPELEPSGEVSTLLEEDDVVVITEEPAPAPSPISGGGGGSPAPSPSPTTDTTPPATITDLTASNITTSSVKLSWTAPGDDNSTGTATSYHIGYLTTPYAVSGTRWFKGAILVEDLSPPQLAETAESKIVSRLSAGTTYYFRIRARDEVRNKSGGSDRIIVATTSSSDTTAPSSITDLTASNPNSSSILLSWTAVGDDGSTGTASSYDVMYSTTTITRTNWRLANQATGEPTPQAAGTSESMTVSSLDPSTTYYLAIGTADEVPRWSDLSNIVSLATTAVPPPVLPDITSPAIIVDLSLSNPGSSSLTLSWTAPGDDGSTGTAASYDVRYSTSNITITEEWTSATQATGEPTPQAVGSAETFTVSGLSQDTMYYFAVITGDEVPNWSGSSNTVNLKTTLPDTTPPNGIGDLAASNPTFSSIDLSWTAPGDDGSVGTATSYDARYSTSNITDANWAAATQATGEPTPQVVGSAESMTISNLSQGITYYFAIKAADEAGNEGGLFSVPSLVTNSCITVASGKQIYFVSMQNQPQIMQIDVDPLDVSVGATQTVTVKIRDTNSNPISVTGSIDMDNGSNPLSFSLTANTDLDGTWTASWTAAGTYCDTYQINITATSASGTSLSVLQPS